MSFGHNELVDGPSNGDVDTTSVYRAYKCKDEFKYNMQKKRKIRELKGRTTETFTNY